MGLRHTVTDPQTGHVVQIKAGVVTGNDTKMVDIINLIIDSSGWWFPHVDDGWLTWQVADFFQWTPKTTGKPGPEDFLPEGVVP